MDALARTRIPGEARQVLDFILRRTYGWHKKSDNISLPQFLVGTGLSKPHICMAINTLKKMNLITEYGKREFGGITEKGKGTTKIYAIIKDFDKWLLLPKKVTVTEKGNRLLPNTGTTKALSTKAIVLTSIKDTPIKPKSEVKVKVKQPPDPRIQVIIDYFQETHLTKTGKKPLFLVQDFPSIKRMLKAASVDDIKKYIDKFFLDQDNFLCDKGKSLNTFTTFGFSRYHSKTGPLPDGDYNE